MGCWNKTCGLSRLHINAGEEVYVFVIEEGNRNDTSRCYTTALYAPLLMPFEAKYDDYGGGEDAKGVALPFILEGLREELVEMPQGENEYHDIPVTRDKFEVENFFEAVHEGRLFVKDYHGENSRVEFVMIRKDVVQNILNTWVQEHYVGDGKGTCGYGNNYILYDFHDVLADVDPFLDALEAKLTGVGDDDSDLMLPSLQKKIEAGEYTPEQITAAKRAMARIRLFDGLGSVIPWKNRDTNKASWYLHRDNYRYCSIINADDLVIDAMEAGNRELAKELLINRLIASYIDSFYNATRNIWAPGCHEGSQAQDEDGYRVLASTIVKVLDDEKRKWDEEDEEFGEDDEE